jgi:hypothetical protein
LTDDCVKRAISVVTGKSYTEVQRELNEYKKITGAKKFNSIKNLRYVEDVLNAKKIVFDRRIKAGDFCIKYPSGRYILDMDEHWSSCVDGCIYDTWNCGECDVNFAYEICSEPYLYPNIKNQIFKYCCTSEKINDTEARIRIYDGNGCFTERIIPLELVSGYVRCLIDSNYNNIEL